VEVLEPIFGTQEKGSNFTFGHSLREEDETFVNIYSDWNIKEVGSLTEYVVSTENCSVDDFNDYLRSLKEKYDG
jgi:hypothetical protein